MRLRPRPRLIREIKLPAWARGLVGGDTLTANGRYLLVADGSGAAVLNAHRAERGAPHAVLGQLDAGAVTRTYAIDVASSPKSDFAFVALEGAQGLAVFDLQRAVATGFRAAASVGTIPMNFGPVGMAISPDGRWLYATSQLTRINSPQQGGTLSLIDLRKAEKRPRRALVARVNAGCGPVRVVVSQNGEVVWVAARESNSVLAFSAAKLRTDPQLAAIGDIRVGEAPVGLTLLKNDTRLIVADSNRFAAPSRRGELSVINTKAALAGQPAVIGAIPAGSFPRDLSVVRRDHGLLVANYNSNQLEVVNTTRIP